MFDRVFPLFLELNRNTGERDAELQEIIEPTILVILQDLLKDRKTNRQDMIDLRKYFFESLKGNYKIQLLSSLVDLIFILSGSNKETNTMLNFQANLLKIDPKNIRSNFARHLKTINLSDEGEIVSLEFEPWSWFCLKYLKANIPNYLNNIKSDYIVNKDDFTTLNPLKKLEELEANDFKDTYSYSAFASDYAKEKLMDKIFGDFERLDKDEKMKYLLNLNTLSFEFLYAYFATILSISDL
jgi:hypothetical protein